MAQYKHDRFFKFYVQALYKTKGETRKNIKVMNDEELEIDCNLPINNPAIKIRSSQAIDIYLRSSQ